MKPIRNIPDKVGNELAQRVSRWREYYPGGGFLVLGLAIFFLSALASFDFTPEKRMLVAGEVATQDIVADRNFLFEDRQATRQNKELARQYQPLVCDLTLVPVDELRRSLQEIIISINQAETKAERANLRITVSYETGEELPQEAIAALSSDAAQNYVMEKILPFLEARLSEGVLSEMRSVIRFKGGIIIRNLNTNEETHYPEVQGVPDLKTVETELTQRLKQMPGNAQARRAVGQLLTALMRPTLLPNIEATKSRIDAVEQAVPPVMLRIAKGEVIVQQGEQISPETQAKLQAMWPKKASRFNLQLFAGLVIVGFLLSTGLLFSPSGKAVSHMERKDFIFIATLVTLFALGAKGLDSLGARLAAHSITFPASCLAYAVPVAGAAALSSLLFSTRRYLVFGLLLAFFCSAMSKGGGLGLFLFYFLSTMWSTWLISRSETRQDMVWSIGPLILGLLAMWAGATFMHGGAYNRYLPEVAAVIGGGVFSMLLTFALAPVVEMVFGYTTRFRLMELLNLEQPILRELMLNAPGTYHHSLIVSNMVEAGAKAIGAQSLLCKVAALYHDIGKISKAGYFIENQFTAENPHDRLSPSMSALILLSHTKKGEELGVTHKLGKEVTNIIRQHHGTGVIRYFYHKAVQMADADSPPKIEDFSYAGPRPQTREAALVMLADAVEASSRILGDPTPSRLRAHIDTVVKGIFTDGQLDDSEMTFRDLDRVSDAFHRILTGMFHHRIEYPDRQRAAAARPAPRVEPAGQKPASAQLEDGTPAGIVGENGAPESGAPGNTQGGAARPAAVNPASAPASNPVSSAANPAPPPRPAAVSETSRKMNGGTVDWTAKRPEAGEGPGKASSEAQSGGNGQKPVVDPSREKPSWRDGPKLTLAEKPEGKAEPGNLWHEAQKNNPSQGVEPSVRKKVS